MKKTKRSGKLSLRWVRPIIILLLSISISPLFLTAQETWIKLLEPFTPQISTSHVYHNRNILVKGSIYLINGWYEDMSNSFAYVIQCDVNGNILSSEIESWNSGANALTLTSDNGVLQSGWFRYTTTAFLIKRDNQGIVEWYNDNVGFRVYSMDQTSEGNIILGGRTEEYDLCFCTLNNTGSQVWKKELILDNYSDGTIVSIRGLSDGDLVMTGWLATDDRDVFVLRTDHNANIRWYRIFDGYGFDDRGLSVDETKDNNIIVSGETGTSSNNLMSLLWLLDSNGNTIEQKLCTFDNEVRTIISLDDGTFVATNPYLIKLDQHLNLLWQSDFFVGGTDKNIGLTNDGGFIFLQTADDYLVLTKTDSQGKVDSRYIEEPDIPAYSVLKYDSDPVTFSITFSFNLGSQKEADLSIYNIKREKIKTLCSESLQSGEYTFNWEGKDTHDNFVSSGMYIAVLKVDGNTVATEMVTLIK